MAAAAESHCHPAGRQWQRCLEAVQTCLNSPAATAQPSIPALLPRVPADLGVARFVGADMRSVAGFCPTHAGAECSGAGLGGGGSGTWLCTVKVAWEWDGLMAAAHGMG